MLFVPDGFMHYFGKPGSLAESSFPIPMSLLTGCLTRMLG